jgi:hypothetical protein
MTIEQKEALEAIEKINGELYKKYSKKDPKNFNYDSLDLMPILAVTIAGVYMLITLSIPSKNNILLDITLYNSEDNDRIFYEKTNTYETFYKLIKRKFLEVKEEIHAVKL